MHPNKIILPLFAMFFCISSAQKSTTVIHCNNAVNKWHYFNNAELFFDYNDCHLDMTPYVYMAFEIENQSSKKILLDINYRGPHKNNVNQGRFFINPHTSYAPRIKLVRSSLPTDSPWLTFFSEVRGLPGGFTKHWNAFDLSKIKGVNISISGANLTSQELSKIKISLPFGAGTYEPPATAIPQNKFPLIDEMGQYNAENWTGKLKNQKLLKAKGIEDQARFAKAQFNENYSKYGGWLAGPKQKATGYFYTKKIHGKWWFVDPEGYLFWSQGVTGAGSGNQTSTKNRSILFPSLEKDRNNVHPADGNKIFNGAKIDFYNLNLKRKYGAQWYTTHQKVTVGRLKSWGMNSMGAWSKPPLENNFPFTIILHPKKSGIGKIEKLPDPFSEAYISNLKAQLRTVKKHHNNPWLLGVFVNNELHWKNEFSIPAALMKTTQKTPARLALEKFFSDKYTQINALNDAWKTNFEAFDKLHFVKTQKRPQAYYNDMIAFYLYFTETYYRVTAAAIKEALPNHLYFGSRLHGESKKNKYIHAAAAKYCDVVSFNIYEYSVKDFKLNCAIDKPIIIGEFHFGTGSHGVWGVGLRAADGLQNQADLYGQYIKEAASNPAIIGAHWFQWSDQMATGRVDGENFRIGIVNVTDQPYEPLTQKMTEMALKKYTIRIHE